jgi:murein DD-endopeptidase MepM/ murein hydrolase activator NlpD
MLPSRRAVATLAVLVLAGPACRGPASDRPAAARDADIELARDREVVEARVPARATLASLLTAHAVEEALAAQIVSAVTGSFDPRTLRADQPYRLVRGMDGLVREFVYRIDADCFLHVRGRGHVGESEFDVRVVPYEKQIAVVGLSAAIDRVRPSLVAAIVGAGERVPLAVALADIFRGEVDSNHDLQVGDAVEVVFEKQFTDGEFARYGPVLAATLRNEGRRVRAFRFTPRGGEPAYYDEQGRSLNRFFLRSPLQFEPRISSGFSYQRRHPVLGFFRAHPAIDYVAPRGAPVVAVAPGVVTKAGWSTGGGRTVMLRHDHGYESSYMHLSEYGRGVRVGARVAQGQVIGCVGATGLATGAHLDYRLKRDGVYVNPLAEHQRMPPGSPVPAADLARFEFERDRVATMFPGAPPVAVASRETAFPADQP